MDTSCCIAALLSESGASATVLNLVLEGKLCNFYTKEIGEEIKKVIARPKFNLEQEKQEHFLHLFKEASFQIQPSEAYQVKECRDPQDDKFLSLAQQIEADVLITIDNDLLTLKKTGKTRIMIPSEFLEFLKEERRGEEC